LGGRSVSTATFERLDLHRTTAAPVDSTPSLMPENQVTVIPTIRPEKTVLPAKTESVHLVDSHPQPACLADKGQIVTGSLDTKLLRQAMNYRVYLPPCYEADLEKRYPVLYMFHGQGFSDDQWERIGINTVADRLIASGEIPAFLVVMPYDRSFGQPTETKFDQVFIEELIPLIDRTYRTIPDRSHRAVGGLSRGGALAIHFAVLHWQMFGALGAHSPAVFHSDGQKLEAWLDAIPPGSFPRVYIDVGDRDSPEISDSATWFEKLLNVRGIAHEWHLFSGYHTEDYWRTHLEQYLRWYTQDW
jgi:enterochelin esterase-like enzyme